ncbi:hypothetical protein MUK51_07210 [Sphingobacterium faecium]|uniref:hypothetical protein n=1 Tax=Sphingobacterium faecium TaxID=34087 RepID=UPI0021B5B2AA|nr:hypothetical protein [Sphingobacterium faecium]UXD71074.1 hypothetical protein MUK51_07210 [Sphingobacterium faecium]
MILLKKERFNEHKKAFELKNPQSTLLISDYIHQYGEVVRYMNKNANNCSYILNSKAFPYLFLTRHLIELNIKEYLETKGEIPKTHDIPQLLEMTQCHFKDKILEILPDYFKQEDDSAFRYFYDKDGLAYDLGVNKIEFLDFIKKHKELESISEIVIPLTDSIVNMKQLEWEFTFHLGELRTPGHFRSQYDDLITFIIEAVIKGDLIIDDIYLPFLFLVRHSIELGLKESVLSIIHIEDDDEITVKIKNKLNSEHSLVRLFNIYDKFLKKVDLSKLEPDLLKEHNDLKEKLKIMNDIVHIMDNNSRCFRYPLGKDSGQNMPLKSDTIIDIVSLLLQTDAFITFNADILKYEGAIEFTDEEMRDMLGISEEYY